MPRLTRQRTAIESAFARARRPLSPTELHAIAARSTENLGLSTVYRTLRRLEDEGLIVPVTVPGEPPRYELAHVAEQHHHHFHCRVCGRVYDIHGCPTGLKNLAPRGFVVEDHTVVLHGRCRDCA
jgi:Fur family ferric uptake transcriptional regulator